MPAARRRQLTLATLLLPGARPLPTLPTASTLFPPAHGLLGRPNPTGRTHWGIRFGFFGPDRIHRTYLAATEILALRFTALTRFGALDIDTTSPYHTLPTIAALFAAAESRELRLTLCRSSESGGWHVYLWATAPVASADMHATLRTVAEAAGINRFENGICEVYPDPNHAKQAFRLPAQPGFAWLSPHDGSVMRACAPGDGAANLTALADWVAAVAMPSARFAGAAAQLAPKPAAAAMPRGRPPKLVPPPRASDGLPDSAALQLQRNLVYRYDRNAARAGKPGFDTAATPRFRKGERLYATGLERPGSRNAALQLVSFYLFFCGYTKAADRELLLLLWLSARHNGQSDAWMDAAERSKIEDEITRLAAWQPTRCGVASAAAQSNAQRRRRSEAALVAAAHGIAERGQAPTTRELSAITGLSLQTVGTLWPRIRRKIIGVIMQSNQEVTLTNLEP